MPRSRAGSGRTRRRAGLVAHPDGSVDLLFLDAERTEYTAWWSHPVRVPRAGGVLVALRR